MDVMDAIDTAAEPLPFKSGLEGVVAAQTRLSDVDGEAGRLTIAGLQLDHLAPRATFEEAVHLLWKRSLPNHDELDAFGNALRSARELPEHTASLIERAAKRDAEKASDPMVVLRMGIASLVLQEDAAGEPSSRLATATSILSAAPTIVARAWRSSQGQEPIAPRSDLSHAANFLYMLDGAEPSSARVRALDTYLNTVIDHGMNASTFTARVITSTASDLVSAIAGAIGALRGPLHGGAPGPALDMVFEIGKPENAEAYLREKLTRGERLMGFGHRVYKVRDPRADVLAAAALRLAEDGESQQLYELAIAVEKTALRLLAELKPGRRLDTNVEFYTALVLHAIGLDQRLFTPTFAVGRTAGWLAHCFEQADTGRLIRPSSVYVGEQKDWLPIDER